VGVCNQVTFLILNYITSRLVPLLKVIDAPVQVPRNVTIRQQIGLEEPIIKEIEQNQLSSYGHVQRMAEGRLPKMALKWMPKQKRARERLKKNWMEGTRKAMNKRNLNEGQWEDREQWSLCVGQHRT
jgi:hypothetical protein